jgi:hypothetical protein
MLQHTTLVSTCCGVLQAAIHACTTKLALWWLASNTKELASPKERRAPAQMQTLPTLTGTQQKQHHF